MGKLASVIYAYFSMDLPFCFLGLLFHHIPFGLMTSDKAVFADAIPLSNNSNGVLW